MAKLLFETSARSSEYIAILTANGTLSTERIAG
jgi:hypothetical protein